MARWLPSVCAALVAAVVLPSAQILRNSAPIPPGQLRLAADRLRADRWFPEGTTYDGARLLNRGADMDLLMIAMGSTVPQLRRVALRELGRFETPDNVAFISSFLEDEDASVRIEAADAVVQTLMGAPSGAAVPVIAAIDRRLLREVDTAVIGALWRAVTRLPLPVEDAVRYERLFLRELQQQGPMHQQAGALLVDLLWNRRGRPAQEQTVRHLKDWLMRGSTQVGSMMLFLEGLQAAGVDDDEVLEIADRAASLEIRLRAVEMRNPFKQEHRWILEEMVRRPDPAIREAAMLRLMTNTGVPLCNFVKTPVGVLVQLELMTRLAAMQGHEYPECPEWRAERELLLMAEKLRTAEGQFNWQVPIVALELVARVMPDEAGSIARAEGLTHRHWVVRAAVARIAGITADPDTALSLVDDAHPNVRTEALRTLALLAHLELPVHAATALESTDHQLVLTAAQVLAEAPDAVALLPPVFAAFERLTKEGRDTSRETRTALLNRIVELGVRVPDAAGWAVRLRPHTEDWDPVIAARVAEVQTSLSGTADPVRPTYRTPAQPDVAALSGLPACLHVHFAGADPWRLEMHLDRAPIAAARFWALVKAGYYNGQDVQASDHRQVLIGSPAANDFVGTDRYWRDEVGSPVRKGALILRNHGRDTVDGRLQLVREDHRTADGMVTVLASVQESARRPVLPGDRIVRIVECPPPR